MNSANLKQYMFVIFVRKIWQNLNVQSGVDNNLKEI